MKTMNIYKLFRNKTARTISAGILVLLMSACHNDILNLDPQTSILDSKAYSTASQILAQVNGLYASAKADAFYGGAFLIWNEQRGEEFLQNSGNTADGGAIWNENALASADQVSRLWSAAYLTINKANILIDQVGHTTVVDTVTRRQYLAEAKFLRALSYFALIQVYARPYADQNGTKTGIPLRLTGNTSLVNGDLAPSSVAEVYNQIISDLNSAEANLPVGYSTAALNASRAHKSTAIALKTRVYLVKQDWANVVTEAKKIVSNTAPYQYTETGQGGTVTHKLETSVVTLFGGSYTGNEAILTFPFNATDAPSAQAALAYYYTDKLVSTADPTRLISTDSAQGSLKDPRLSVGSLIKKSSGKYILLKFSKISPYLDYVPAIRYAEVLLNYAEASARNGDLTTATNLLYAVRNRANASWTFDASAISTQEALINTILKERRIELLGEGFRVLDIIRLLNTIPAKGSIPAVAPTDNNYIWPIPSSEKATNSLI